MASPFDNPFLSVEPEFGFGWAAGLFEGEGTICPVKSGTTTSLRIAIGMCDKDVLDRFLAIVGVGHINGPYAGKKVNHRPTYFWRCGRREEQIQFINRIWPYLSQRRRQQVIDAYEKITPITTNRAGRPRLQAVA